MKSSIVPLTTVAQPRGPCRNYHGAGHQDAPHVDSSKTKSDKNTHCEAKVAKNQTGVQFQGETWKNEKGEAPLSTHCFQLCVLVK